MNPSKKTFTHVLLMGSPSGLPVLVDYFDGETTGLKPPPSVIADFKAVVTALLPHALPELQAHGVMTTCAHCGRPFDGAAIQWVENSVPGDFFDLNILALCKADAANLPKASPFDWAHISETSGLFPEVHEWEMFIRGLRSAAVTARRKK